MVVDRVLLDLNKDKEYLAAIEKRRMARERNEKFLDDRYIQAARNLPQIIKPNINGLTREDLQIYANFKNYDQSGVTNDIEFSQAPQRKSGPTNAAIMPSNPVIPASPLPA